VGCYATVTRRDSGQAEPESKTGAQAAKQVHFENRSGAYFRVREFRQAQKSRHLQAGLV
jgi:hypothetical protein